MMWSDIWSSTASYEEKRQPGPITEAPAPISNADDIQILLLGAPGSGKTSLQTRYTLRQFANAIPGGAHLMGGHRHVPLPNGGEVHLIIHEFPSRSGHSTSSIMDPFGTDDISRHETLTSSYTTQQADMHRKKLLEQSDAVMLLFNPWSKESFEWANGSVVDDIINASRNKKPTADIASLLDDLAAAVPEIPRTKSMRSAKSLSKDLPRMPSSMGDASLTGFDENREREGDRSDYQGELKRLSILVEGSALKRAEFMIHERDLPSPPEKSPAPQPLEISGPVSLSDRKLPTIREVESYTSLRRDAVLSEHHHHHNQRKEVPGKRRDSAVSFRSTSSAYSHASSTIYESRQTSSLRDSKEFTLEDLVAAHSDPPEEEEDEEDERPPKWATLPLPVEDIKMPVLIVASMMDRLSDLGGNLPRVVSEQQGRELARRFGPNCAYTEVSAKANTNVDEAYGILVDEVRRKRAMRQKDEMASRKLEDLIVIHEEGPRVADDNDRSLPAIVVRAKRSPKRSRSCMPAWWDKIMRSVFSWGLPGSEVSAITFEDPRPARKQLQEGKEDVWGETVVIKGQRKASLGALRKTDAEGEDSRQSSPTTSTALGDPANGDNLVKEFQFKTNGSMTSKSFNPDEAKRSTKTTTDPSLALYDDGKKPRPDEALFDKLDRKISKRNFKSGRTTLQPEPPNGPASSLYDEDDSNPRRNETILYKVSHKIGLDAGPLPVEEDLEAQLQPSIPKSTRPLSMDSSLSRSLTRSNVSQSLAQKPPKSKPEQSQFLFASNYAPAATIPINRSRSKSFIRTKKIYEDDNSSSIITTATTTIQQRRQHTSLVSELPPYIPPLPFDTIPLDKRRFTVLIRLAEQELEQQRERVSKLHRDDAAASAPVTRSASVGARAGEKRRRMRMGVGTTFILGSAVAAAHGARPAAGEAVSRGRQASNVKAAAAAAAAAGVADGGEPDQKQVFVVHVDPDSGRTIAPKRQNADPPVDPPPRRPLTTVGTVPPPPPVTALRPRTRPSSERRPNGRPARIWI